ncbi:MAG: class II aldolase/adducin family protein [Sumerlaeia bacterium]
MTTATFDIRDAICEVGRRLWHRGFVANNDGNISFRLDENTVLATPTMISKGFLTPHDLVLVDLDGNQVGGERRLTSEIRMHLHAYRTRSDISAVVHAHPPHATAFAITGRALPKGVLPEAELFLGEVPVVPYRLPGTWELARSLGPWLAHRDTLLLQNHGAIAVGTDPFDAYYRMETLDQVCRVLLLGEGLGTLNTLTVEEHEELIGAKAAWRIADSRAGMRGVRLREPSVHVRRQDPAWAPAREPFDGARFPRVTDEPKASTAPEPTDAPPLPRPSNRPSIEAAVREVLAALGR